MPPKKGDTRVNFVNAEKKLLSGDISQAYLLAASRYRPEPYLQDRFISLLKAEYLGENASPMSVEVCRAEADKPEKIISSLYTNTFFGGRRLIVIHSVERLTQSTLKAVEGYLKNPSPDICLVMTTLNFDARRKYNLIIAPHAIAVRTESPFPDQVPAWINRFAGEKGKTIEPEAVGLLQAYVGENLQALRMETIKLSLFVGEQDIINTDDVKGAIGFSKQLSQFDLEGFIAEKNLSASLKTVNDMLERGAEPPRITIGLYNFLSSALLNSEKTSSAGSGRSIREKVLAKAAAHWTTEQLRKGIIRIRDADLEFKSRRTPLKLIFTRLIVELMAEA